MDLKTTPLPDLYILTQSVFDDARGFLRVVFREDEMIKLGLPFRVVQVNHSRSRRGVVRGLHFQHSPPLGKIIRVIRGTAFMVFVDLRKRSPGFGKFFTVELTDDRAEAVSAPAGFAAGFCALSEWVDVEYLYNAPYAPAGESNIAWNDPELNIPWTLNESALIASGRDAAAQTFSEWTKKPESDL